MAHYLDPRIIEIQFLDYPSKTSIAANPTTIMFSEVCTLRISVEIQADIAAVILFRVSKTSRSSPLTLRPVNCLIVQSVFIPSET